MRIGTESTLDHFLISPNLISSVSNYETFDMYNNFSDHSPIMLSLNIDIESFNTENRLSQARVAWHKCNDDDIDNYKDGLDTILLQKVNPNHEALRCRTHNCKDHTEFIRDLHNVIIDACNEASTAHLKYTNHKGGRKIIPGWNDHVKEYAREAKYWHDVWVRDGKKRGGDIAEKKRISRLQYHYAIRCVKQENERIRNIKMAEAISLNNSRALWDEARKMTKTNNNLPIMMDGSTDTNEIANIFSNRYNTLYNSVGYASHDMDQLKKDIEERIVQNPPSHAIPLL